MTFNFAGREANYVLVLPYDTFKKAWQKTKFGGNFRRITNAGTRALLLYARKLQHLDLSGTL